MPVSMPASTPYACVRAACMQGAMVRGLNTRCCCHHLHVSCAVVLIVDGRVDMPLRAEKIDDFPMGHEERRASDSQGEGKARMEVRRHARTHTCRQAGKHANINNIACRQRTKRIEAPRER